MPIETQLREIFDAMGDGVFIASPEGRYLDVNPSGCRMLGYTRDEILTLHLPDLLDPSEIGRLPATIASYASGSVRRSEWRFLRKDGSVFVGELVGGQLPDGRLQSIVRDVTHRIEIQEREQLLRREAAHRTKNVLSIVQAIARQVARYSQEAFLPAFEERLVALSRSNDLFAGDGWNEIDLATLVNGQLAFILSAESARFSIHGPPVSIDRASAQSIGMALHELATNAMKYGALSNEDGHVEISWALGEGGTGRSLALVWRESGGPPVTPPESSGFGTRMIAHMVERTLNARTVLDYAPTGLVWSAEWTLP